MKSKRTTILIIFITILLIIALIGLISFKISTNKENAIEENVIEEVPTETSKEGMEQALETFEFETDIPMDEPIEKDGVEIENIHLKLLGNQLEVKTTMKNNTGKPMNGYLIEIELLNNSGEVLTTLTDSSQDILEVGQSKDITNYVMNLIYLKDITGARIKSIEKSNIIDSTNQMLEDMIPNTEDLN